jgi:cell division transport system permease protein
MWYGCIGAVLAAICVNLLVLFLNTVFEPVAIAYQLRYTLHGLSALEIVMLILFAMILGWIAAHLSVKKQLALIQPS